MGGANVMNWPRRMCYRELSFYKIAKNSKIFVKLAFHHFRTAIVLFLLVNRYTHAPLTQASLVA